MLAMAKERNIEVGFNTNATLLDGRHRKMLLDLGIDWVHVSIDAASREVFEGIRLRANFDKVVGNLRSLVEERGPNPKPRVQLNAVLMRRTVRDLEGLVRLAADLAVDRLWIQQLSHDLGDTAHRSDFDGLRTFTNAECLWTGPDDGEDAALVRRALGAAVRLADQLGVEIRIPEINPPLGEPTGDQMAHVDELPCDWPWRSAYVNHDGGVQPCCMLMGEDRAHMGNLHDAGGFAGVWNGEAYHDFRQKLLSPEPPDVCRSCANYRHRF
jgi:radical SAM protein with 4Fe4S-binding SPASM domain